MKDTNFSVKWFNRSIEPWKKYLKDIPAKARYLEIGCWEGQATRWVLDNYDIKEAHVVDTFAGNIEHHDDPKWSNVLPKLLETFHQNVDPHIHKISIHKGKSQEMLRSFPLDKKFDVIYIDGSHWASDVLEDAVLAFRLLNIDGIMIFDDFGWHRYEDERLTPALGITSFLQAYDGQYEYIDKGYQIAIKKIEFKPVRKDRSKK